MTISDKRLSSINRLHQLIEEAKVLEPDLTVREETGYQYVSTPGGAVKLTEYTILADGKVIFSKSSYSITPEQESEGVLEQETADFLEKRLNSLKNG